MRLEDNEEKVFVKLESKTTVMTRNRIHGQRRIIRKSDNGTHLSQARSSNPVMTGHMIAVELWNCMLILI